MEVEARGMEAYTFVEAGRQVLWCSEDRCAHQVARDTFGQVHQNAMTLEQLHRLGELEYLRRAGHIRLMALRIGQGPGPDKDRERNRRILQEALMGQRVVIDVYDGAGHERDGVIEWEVPVPVTSYDDERGDADSDVILQPGSAALEIGYTLPSRTYEHLYMDGAVWRWPYRSERLWLCAHVRELDDGWRHWPMHPGFSGDPGDDLA